MPPITRSQTKLQRQRQMQMQMQPQKQMQWQNDYVINKRYNINEFIKGILTRAANVTNSNIDSDFDSFMKKYTDNDRLRLHQKYPELDIVKVEYQIQVLCYYNDSEDILCCYNNDDEEYEDGFVYIALPKNVGGNILDINIKNIFVKFNIELNLFAWTIKSIKQCHFIK